MIEAEPSFGYRTVAAPLGMNKNTVQRIFQLRGWMVRKRVLGQRSRIEAKVLRAEKPDERWVTGLCLVLGRQRRLAQSAARDRLQYAATARLTPVTR